MKILVLGTRIVYERKFLLQCRNSPLSKSPPYNLPTIPGVTTAAEQGAEGDKLATLSEESAGGNAKPKENVAPAGGVRSKFINKH